MKIASFGQTYTLEPATVDEISEKIEQFLTSIDMERANVIRIKFAMEEALLRWMDRFGTGNEIKFNYGMSIGRPIIKSP